MTRKQVLNHMGFAYFLLAGLALLAQYLLTAVFDWALPQVWDLMLASWLVSLVPLYLIGMPVGHEWMQRNLPKMQLKQYTIGPKKWLSFLTICIFIMYAGNIIGNILSAILTNLSGLTFGADVLEVIESSQPWMTLVFAVIIAPVMEELLFRKVLLDRVIVLGDKTAIILSGLLFGLLHGNVTQFFYAFGLGCFFAYIYIRTGKLRYSISLHMAVNFIGGYISSLVIKAAGLSDITESGPVFRIQDLSNIGGVLLLGLYAILMIVLTIIGVVSFVRSYRQKILYGGQLAKSKEKMIISVLKSPGIWAYFAITAVYFVVGVVKF